MNKTGTALTSLAIIASTIVFASVVHENYFPNNGVIIYPELEVWLNGVQLHDGDVIDWGDVEAGYTWAITNMTVKNKDTQPLLVEIIPDSGLPATWTLTWTGHGTTLQPTEKTEADLELSIPAGEKDWPTWGFSIWGSTT